MTMRRLEAWLRLAADRLHDAGRRAHQARPGDRRRGPRHQHGPRVHGHRRQARCARGADRRPPRRGRLADPADLLRLAGKTLISTVGGAAGPLYGTAFLRAAGALAERAGARRRRTAFVAALEAAIGGIAGARQGDGRGEDDARRADPGPGRSSVGRRRRGGRPRRRWPRRPMPRKPERRRPSRCLPPKGRASYLGERSIGHQDPGATSSALLLRALADIAGAG